MIIKPGIPDRPYLYALDLSMKQPGLTIFDLVTFEPVIITHTTTNEENPTGIRLFSIVEMCVKYMTEYPVKLVVMERGFSRFHNDTQALFRVHGVINLLFRHYDQIYYPPTKIKACILNGSATKKQLKERILQTYKNVKFVNEDESDSFAIGLTYLIKERSLKWDMPEVKPKPKAKRKKKCE